MDVLNCIIYFIKKFRRQFKYNNWKKTLLGYFYTQFETRNGNVPFEKKANVPAGLAMYMLRTLIS